MRTFLTCMIWDLLRAIKISMCFVIYGKLLNLYGLYFLICKMKDLEMSLKFFSRL